MKKHDDTIDEPGVGTDLAAIADGCGTLQDRSRVQRHIAPEAHRDVGRVGVEIQEMSGARQTGPRIVGMA